MKKKIILVFLMILILIALIYLFINEKTKENKVLGTKDEYKEERVNVNNYDLVLYNDSNVANNVYMIKFESKSESNPSIISKLYQLGIDKLIEKKKNKYYYNYNNPLLILNPYGTNITGLYIYFKTIDEYKVEYTISVPNSDIPNYSNTLSSGYTKEHENQIIGLIQGVKNVIEIRLLDNNKIKYKYEFSINMPDFETNSIKKIDSEIIKEEELDNDLYTFLILQDLPEPNYSPLSFYDKYGVLRAEIVNESDRHTNNIIFIGELYMYIFDTTHLVLMNNLGKVVKTIELNSLPIHDYIYDKSRNVLIYITGHEEIRYISLSTYEDNILIDMNKLFKNYYDDMVKKYNDKEIDWSHLNSVDLVNDNDIIISMRSNSSIVYIENIYENPKIKYILAPESNYENTVYEKLLYKQIGDFSIHAGQHTVMIIKDDNLLDGQYYLYLFNNNYAKQNLSLESSYYEEIEGVGTDNVKASKSMYYKYLIDENNETFSLVDEIDVPYQNSKSNVHFSYDNHIIMGLSKTKELYEYNEFKEILLKLHIDIDKDFYRAYKVSMKGFWF